MVKRQRQSWLELGLLLVLLFVGYALAGWFLTAYRTIGLGWLGTLAITTHLAWAGMGAMMVATAWVLGLVWTGAYWLAWPQDLPWAGVAPWAGLLTLGWALGLSLAVGVALVRRKLLVAGYRRLEVFWLLMVIAITGLGCGGLGTAHF